jgi:hypothetical protein
MAKSRLPFEQRGDTNPRPRRRRPVAATLPAGTSMVEGPSAPPQEVQQPVLQPGVVQGQPTLTKEVSRSFGGSVEFGQQGGPIGGGPIGAHPIGGTMAGLSSGSAILTLTVQPSLITPTVYPAPPGDTVTVEDPVVIDTKSPKFRELKETIERLCGAIEQSNEASREVGQKLVAELQAGLKIIEAPKPSRKMLMLLLVSPLYAAAGIFAASFVGELAKHAADLLSKLMGMN